MVDNFYFSTIPILVALTILDVRHLWCSHSAGNILFVLFLLLRLVKIYSYSIHIITRFRFCSTMSNLCIHHVDCFCIWIMVKNICKRSLWFSTKQVFSGSFILPSLIYRSLIFVNFTKSGRDRASRKCSVTCALLVTPKIFKQFINLSHLAENWSLFIHWWY